MMTPVMAADLSAVRPDAMNVENQATERLGQDSFEVGFEQRMAQANERLDARRSPRDSRPEPPESERPNERQPDEELAGGAVSAATDRDGFDPRRAMTADAAPNAATGTSTADKGAVRAPRLWQNTSPAPVAEAQTPTETEQTQAQLIRADANPPTETPADDATWSVWAQRNLGAQAAEAAPEAEAITTEDGQAIDAQMELDAAVEGSDAASTGSDGGAEAGDSMPQGAAKPDPSADGEANHGIFEVSGKSADVQGNAEARPGARTRWGAATNAVRDAVRMRMQTRGATQTATVDVKVDGETVTIKVSVHAGRVDVDVRGLDSAELSRMRSALGQELERHNLSLGDVQGETAGWHNANQHQGHAEGRHSAFDGSPDPSNASKAPRGAAEPSEGAAVVPSHDGLWITA